MILLILPMSQFFTCETPLFSVVKEVNSTVDQISNASTK